MGDGFEPIPQSTERIASDVIDAAFAVHKTLGPGLLESAYEVCLAHELERRGHAVLKQVALPVVYENVRLEAGYRIDLMIDGVVVVEVKRSKRWRPCTKRNYSHILGCLNGVWDF